MSDWIIVNIDTDDTDMLCNRLSMIGIDAVEIVDRKNLDEFLTEQRERWDFVDEDVYKKTDGSRVRVYVPDSKTETVELIKTVLNPNEKITLGSVKSEDWENAQRKYFKSIKIGKSIVIKPEWEEYTAKTGEAVVAVDPGVAFGTGEHETTRMCIEALENCEIAGKTVLDVGCGSGILSLCALALGAKYVRAVDADPLAVKITRSNGVLNGYNEDKLKVTEGDLTDDITKKFDVAAANIIADAIVKLAKIIKQNLNSGGIFICGGIIREKADGVRAALMENGFIITDEKVDGEWVSFSCREVS